ncbi:DUF485 domain-containing protein [Propionibacteriaceae bacterium G1746]
MPERVHAAGSTAAATQTPDKPRDVTASTSNANPDFVAAADSPDYRALRSTFRRFAFPMTVAALVAYFTYVLLSIYAVDFMSEGFLGLQGINLGTALGLAQFAIVWIWTAIYVRWTDRKLDPTAGAIKARLENGVAA